MLQESSGFWGITLGLIVLECHEDPDGTNRRLPCLPFEVPSKYYPWALLALFSLLGSPLIPNGSATCIGYLYVHGYLEAVTASAERISSWERGCLASHTARPGYVGSSQTGSYMPVGAQPATAQNSVFANFMNRPDGGAANQQVEGGEAHTQHFPGSGQSLSAVGRGQTHASQTSRAAARAAAEARLSQDKTINRLSASSHSLLENGNSSSLQAGRQQSGFSFEMEMAQLQGMGYSAAQSAHALEACNGNVRAAVELLTNAPDLV